MTLGINITEQDKTYDWTGLRSGHIRPLKVEEAYTDQIDAWGNYIAACDEGKTNPELEALRLVAIQKGQAYQSIYLTWAISQQDCTCRPGRPDEGERVCPACTAKHYLDDGEMPY
jgi:hypothetical protein